VTWSVDLGGEKLAGRKSAPTARVHDIITLASEITQIHRRDILGLYRFPEIAAVRQACYLVAREAGHSYPRIAELMGRQHSSVHYGAKIAFKRCKSDGDYAAMVQRLRERISGSRRFLLEAAA